MELLYYSAFSLLLIKYFSPLEPVRNWIITRLINFMIKRNWWFLQHVITVISCPYCFSTWFTLAMTFSVWKAALVGTLTLILVNVIEALKKYLEEDEN
jgi:hypothetical protein